MPTLLKVYTMVLILSGITGCAPIHAQSHCGIKGVKDWLSEDRNPLCLTFQDITNAALQQMQTLADVRPAALGIIAGTTVWSTAHTGDISCGGLAHIDGCEWETVSPQVLVNSTAGALLHEFLHVWDVNGLRTSPDDSAAHIHWTERGWVLAGDMFDREYQPTIVHTVVN